MSLTFQTPEKSKSFQVATGRRQQGSLPGHHPMLAERGFLEALRRERRRSERSAKPFVLMLARLQQHAKNGNGNSPIHKLAAAICRSVRETDTMGWYEEGTALGVIFTELGDAERTAVLDSLKHRLRKAMTDSSLELESFALTLTFHFFPEDPGLAGHKMDFNLYPE